MFTTLDDARKLDSLIDKVKEIVVLGGVLHYGFLPYHRNDGFPGFTQEPDAGSRHLYAGCHPGRRQASPPSTSRSIFFIMQMADG